MTAEWDEASEKILKDAGGQVRGFVPQVEITDRATRKKRARLVPWYDAASTGKKQWETGVIPEDVIASFQSKVPLVRREAQQRYDELVRRLLGDMRQVKAVLGRYEIPASIRKQLAELAWKEGHPNLVKRIEEVEPAAVEVYAKFLMRDAAAKQREKDAGKLTLDWHGHYNA